MSLYPWTMACEGCGKSVKVRGRWYCGSCAVILGVDSFHAPQPDDRDRLKQAWKRQETTNA